MLLGNESHGGTSSASSTKGFWSNKGMGKGYVPNSATGEQSSWLGASVLPSAASHAVDNATWSTDDDDESDVEMSGKSETGFDPMPQISHQQLLLNCVQKLKQLAELALQAEGETGANMPQGIKVDHNSYLPSVARCA